jgi:hypothetical protein
MRVQQAFGTAENQKAQQLKAQLRAEEASGMHSLPSFS